jgi:hypothetical protein
MSSWRDNHLAWLFVSGRAAPLTRQAAKHQMAILHSFAVTGPHSRPMTLPDAIRSSLVMA